MSRPAHDRLWPGEGARPTRRASVEDAVTLRIGGGPEAAANARRAVATLRADLDPSVEETLRLLVTELVANSVRHANADAVTLRAVVGPSAVRIEVTDSGPGFDPSRTGSPRDDHTGWGLFLVERLAARWGVAKTGQATRVWFELPRA
jgi:anti-sigma regulatory factor (Ser/Thr protein kinase)